MTAFRAMVLGSHIDIALASLHPQPVSNDHFMCRFLHGPIPNRGEWVGLVAFGERARKESGERTQK